MIISKKMKRRCSSHFEQGFNNHGTTIYVVAQITQTMIDPMEWKQECERVAPRLEGEWLCVHIHKTSIFDSFPT